MGDQEVPLCGTDCDKTYVAELQHDDTLEEGKPVLLQLAILYVYIILYYIFHFILYIQKIEIDQDDEEDLEGFLNNHNDVDIEPWTDVNILTLTDTNSATSEGGNIIIESNSGHIFEISTENYEDSTSMIICQLSELLKKTGVKIILN